MNVEKATIKDATQMHKLINYFADMLARPLSQIYENIRDYFVVREGEQVIACAALHVSWSDLAEVKSLVVAEESQQQRIGTQLVEACLGEAKELGIVTVFTLTYQPGFFEKCGFSQVDKSELSHKVWGECYLCPKFPNCDEVALIRRFEV
ncbi:N-acetyltransferase [Chloroflexota bacterium]